MNKDKTPKKETISEIMNRFDAVFSLQMSDGWANISFEKNYKDEIKMIVKFFDSEGNPATDDCGDGGSEMKDIEKVADFMRELKTLKLDEMTSTK